jgi:hypothetical protein
MMLIYTGGGFGGALPNIPARDLTDEEVARYGGAAALVATGLYARAEREGTENAIRVGKFTLYARAEREARGVAREEPFEIVDLRVDASAQETSGAGQALAARKRKEQ